MKLRYILGNSGSGKFYICMNEILKIQEEQKSYTIFIVPEQFTLQAEKKLIEKSHSKVLFNTEVLSFKRLAYRVFSETGISEKIPLEDVGKIMLLRKILYKLGKKNELVYFSENSYCNIGLLDKINNIMKEFFEFKISINDLEKVINYIDNLKYENLIMKIKDLKNIYRMYIEFTKKDYITDEDILDILSEKIENSKYISSFTQIYIYGFEEFNNQELNIIYKLIEKCKNVNISFTLNTKNIYENNINHFDPYFKVKYTIKKINNKFKDKFGDILPEVLFLEEDKRHKDNVELAFLEKNFFLYPYNKFKDEVHNISILSMNNKYIEIEKVAEKILDLIKNQNYKFKDISVILADISYQKPLKFIFNKYNIPYFLDYKKNVTNHPLTELISSALDIYIYNWQYDAVFRYLKTGFLDILNICNLDKNKINLIENYVLQYGIKGDKWKKDFEYGFYNNSFYEKEEINKIRINILNSLTFLDFKKNKKYTVFEISKKILDFLVDLKVDKTLEVIMDKDRDLFEESIISNTGVSDEHIQVWNSICLILQKFVDILGDEKITLEEYSKILKTAFDKETIGIIPPKQDQVLIGDFDRTKLTDNKVLFAIGMNEGNIPKYKDESPFISDIEKEILLENGIEMRTFSSTNLFTDMLNVYSLLLKPKDKLYLTFSKSSIEGSSKKLSSILNRILNIFPKIKIQFLDEFDFSVISSPCATFEKIFKNFEKIEEINNIDYFKDIFVWFLNNEEYSKKINHIAKGIEKLSNIDNDSIKNEFLQQLYKNNQIISSVSRLEEFRKCPFSYFLKYNLGIKEREIHILDYLKIGNLYHKVLEKFSSMILRDKEKFKNLSKSEIYLIIENIIEEIKEKEEVLNLFNSSAKYAYYVNRIKKITAMSTQAIINQLKEGSFVPIEFEVDFDNIDENSSICNLVKIKLDNNYEMILKGKIDRVDKLIFDDKEYIKIIDYKSSEQKLEIEKVYYGLQLQILTYLDAFIKIEKNITNKNILPAGAFYFHMKETILKEDKSEEDIYKDFNMRGVIYKDDNVLKGIDNQAKLNEKKVSSRFISCNDILEVEQFKKLLLLSNFLSKKLGEEITNGNISIYPYKYGKITGCDYCEYSSICNFEILDKDVKYNFMNCIKKEEIWSKIDEKIIDK